MSGVDYLNQQINWVLRAVQEECVNGHPAEVSGGDVIAALDALDRLTRLARGPVVDVEVETLRGIWSADDIP